MSKTDRVLEYLLKHGSITGAEALNNKEVKAYRLSQYISDLRYKRGLDIECHMETKVDEFGETVRYGIYTINEEQRKELLAQRSA